MVNLGTGACFRLNHVGAELWSLLAAGNTVGGSIDSLGARYDITREILEAEAIRLLTDLLSAGLVVAVGADGNGQP